MNRARIFCWLAALGLTLPVAYSQAPSLPPAQVEVAIAQVRDMAPLVDVSGTVISLNDARIAAEVEGVLTWLANVGDPVEKGAVVARIDPRLMQVEQKRARAMVARLQADLDYRQSQLKRSEDLAATEYASRTLLDENRAQRDIARHDLADAKARLERSEGDLARTQIRAPFSGHITARLRSVGEYLTVGEDVMRLVDTQQKEITLPAPIALAPFVEIGAKLDVRSGQLRRQQTVRTVVPVGDAVSRMVEIRLSAADSPWLVGTPVQISLPSARPVTVVAVPRDALVERAGQAYVYRISADNTAEQVVANIRATVGLWIGIASGIEAGDQVVVRGAERLAPGQPVELIKAAASR